MQYLSMGGWQHDEAFETNNWYDDIFTRDRSPEGAEEAIDLSRGFKNPNFKVHMPPSAPAAGESHRAQSGLRAQLPER